MKKISPNPDNYGMMVLTISRKEIEDFDHIDILNFLDEIKMKARKYEGKFNIVITGFDDDERELHQIEDVRRYFDFLDRCFPYWFFFLIKTLPPKYSPIVMLITLLVPIETLISKDSQLQTIQLNIPKLQQFIATHFDFLNELTDELGLPVSENARISQEVMSNILII